MHHEKDDQHLHTIITKNNKYIITICMYVYQRKNTQNSCAFKYVRTHFRENHLVEALISESDFDSEKRWWECGITLSNMPHYSHFLDCLQNSIHSCFIYFYFVNIGSIYCIQFSWYFSLMQNKQYSPIFIIYMNIFLKIPTLLLYRSLLNLALSDIFLIV